MQGEQHVHGVDGRFVEGQPTKERQRIWQDACHVARDGMGVGKQGLAGVCVGGGHPWDGVHWLFAGDAFKDDVDRADGDARPRRRRTKGVMARVQPRVQFGRMQHEAMNQVECQVPHEQVYRYLQQGPTETVLERVLVQSHAARRSKLFARVMEELDVRCASEHAHQAPIHIAVEAPPAEYRRARSTPGNDPREHEVRGISEPEVDHTGNGKRYEAPSAILPFSNHLKNAVEGAGARGVLIACSAQEQCAAEEANKSRDLAPSNH